MIGTTNDMTNDIGKLKSKILDLITEYENKYNIEIHISEFKYDHLKHTKDFNLLIFKNTVSHLSILQK